MSDTPLADALKDRYCFSHLDWYKLCGELEREIAKLRAHAERVGEANDRLAVENDDLRKDKARMDWFLKLEEDDRVKFCRGWYRWTPEKAKAEIDAELRKEAQP